MNDGSAWWIVLVNVVIWTGLFLVVLRLHSKLNRLEKDR